MSSPHCKEAEVTSSSLYTVGLQGEARVYVISMIKMIIQNMRLAIRKLLSRVIEMAVIFTGVRVFLGGMDTYTPSKYFWGDKSVTPL